MKMPVNIFHMMIIALFAWLVVTMLTPYGLATTPDSLHYLDMAANIHNGHGALATDFNVKEDGKQAYIEQRLWPVLYPALLSIFVDNVSDVAGAASMAKILMVITALLVYLILSRNLHRFVALPASLLLCVTTPMTTIYTYAWSETLFVPLLLMAVLLSIQFLDYREEQSTQKTITGFLLLATLLALFYTRYIGLAFSTVFALLYVLSKNRDIRIFIALGTTYIIVAAFMLFDNYSQTGNVSGGERGAAGKSLAGNLYDLLVAIQLVVASSWVSVIGTLLVLLVIVVLYSVLNKNGQNTVQQKPVSKMIYVLAFFTVVYLASIVTLRTYSHFDDLDVRFLAPAFPLLWILLCLGMAYFMDKKWQGLAGFLIAGFLLVLLPVKGYFHILSVPDNWNEKSSPGHSRTLGKAYANFTLPENNNPLKNILDEVLAKQVRIITDKPLFVSFVSGRKAIQHPPQIDMAYLQHMNQFSEAVMLIEKGRDPFAMLRQTHNIDYVSLDLRNTVLVQLPVKATIK